MLGRRNPSWPANPCCAAASPESVPGSAIPERRGSSQITVQRRSVGSICRNARIERIRIHGNARNVRRIVSQELGIRQVVGVPRDWRHVIVGTACFVIAPEEDRILPRRARHKSIEQARHLSLTHQNRLPRSRMFIVIAIARLDPREAGQRAIRQVGGELGERSDVIHIDAKSVVWIPHSGS